MSTITLNAEMTKNEFRKAFTDNFDHIYLRVKADKAGKTKLSDSKYFTVGAEISVDKNVTVAEFEKEATAKTGMDVSIYYETKPEAGKSKYYLVRKNDSDTTLSDLESRVAEMDDIVSQKEYMDKLVNGKKSANTSEVKDEKLESKNNIGSTIQWRCDSIEGEEEFDDVHNQYVPEVIKMIETTYELVSIDMFILKSGTYIAYNADVDIELFKDEYDEILLEEDYILRFNLADKNIDKNSIMENFRNSLMNSKALADCTIGFYVDLLNREKDISMDAKYGYESLWSSKYGYDEEDFEFYIR